MLEGILTPALRDIDYLTPTAPYPANPSGITNFIKPGHYQLALSDDREFLYLLESHQLVAVIPVFKLAENESELKKYRDKNKELTKAERKSLEKEEKRKKREEKRRKIIETKYAQTGATLPQKEYKHMEAHIDYIKEGGYYLIRYEKGFIRAWGAIKVVN